VASYWYLDNITVYSGTMGDGLPCVDAGGPYTAIEGGAVTLAATAATLTAIRSPTHGIWIMTVVLRCQGKR